MNSIWLLATPRSGSNWLLTYFSMNGIYNLGESLYTEGELAKRKFFNPKYKLFDDPEFSASELKQFMLAVASKNGDPIAMKMMGYALPHLDKIKQSRPLNYLFGRITYLYLKRNDTLRQAISLYIANQTNIWAKTGLHSEKRDNVEYDLEAIRLCQVWIQTCYRYVDTFIVQNNITPLMIDYDELQSDTEKQVRRMFNYCCLDDHQLKLDTWINIQRDDVNEQFYEKAKAAGL